MQAVAVILLISIAYVSSTEFTDCGSSATDVTLDFEGCENPPCIVERGHDYDAFINFKATDDSQTVTNTISANIGGFETPWPGLDKNGCNNLEAGETPCPVESGSSYTWYMVVSVLSDYPTLTTLATLSFVDDNGASIVCLKVPVTIV